MVTTVFGGAMHFNLSNGRIPLLTKKVAWKTCLKELFFIKEIQIMNIFNEKM